MADRRTRSDLEEVVKREAAKAGIGWSKRGRVAAVIAEVVIAAYPVYVRLADKDVRAGEEEVGMLVERERAAGAKGAALIERCLCSLISGTMAANRFDPFDSNRFAEAVTPAICVIMRETTQ